MRFAFEAPFWGLGATYDVHLRLIGKLVGDFLLVIIELFRRCFRFVTMHAFDRRTDVDSKVRSNEVMRTIKTAASYTLNAQF